ncbi:MAG: hypothetical protein ACRDN9_08970 [Streptosporangiaceae bacterium]
MGADSLLDGLLVIAAVVVVVGRQMTARRVGGRATVLPLVMVGYGLYTAFLAEHPTGLVDHRHVWAGLVLLLGGIALAAALGVWRGMTMRTWRDGAGVLWRKGTRMTAVAWAASAAARVLLVFGGGYLLHIREPMGAILLTVGVTLIVQNIIVALRAERAGPGARPTVMA